MHPSRFPFVLNGPLCACGHRRVSHVRVHPRYEIPAHDLGCSECELCESYTPIEAVDHEAETLQRDQIREAEARRTAAHHKVASLQVVATVLMVPTIMWKPELFPWLIAPVLLTGVVNLSVAALARWRRGELEGFDVMVEAGLAVGVVAFIVALLAHFPPIITTALIAIVMAFGFVFALRIKGDMKHSTRSFNALVADLRDRNGDDEG